MHPASQRQTAFLGRGHEPRNPRLRACGAAAMMKRHALQIRKDAGALRRAANIVAIVFIPLTLSFPTIISGESIGRYRESALISLLETSGRQHLNN
jgi:hypothetical protein